MKFTWMRMIALLFMIAFSAACIYVPRNIEAAENRKKQQAMDAVFGVRPVVLQYTSPDCSTCKAMRPVVRKLKQDYSGRVDFVEVSVDSEQAIALREMFPPEYLPSFFLLFDRDTVYTRVEGEISDEQFRSMLDDMLTAPKNMVN